MKWQPIETAPKDGSWVFLAGGTFEYRWDGDTEPPLVVGQYTNYRNGSRYDDGWWQCVWYDGGYLGEYEDPTLWLPLGSLPSLPSPSQTPSQHSDKG